MAQRRRAQRWILTAAALTIGLCGIAGTTNPRAADPPSDAPASPRVPLAVARDRARLMHDIYEETLHVLHQRYFHGDRATVPARAMEDVFATLARQSRGTARWIAVNTKPMNIDHEPEDAFEKQAATRLASGQTEFELVENGVYRRAAPIPLTAGCLRCHVGFGADAAKSPPRFAGLAISIPVEPE
uniref:DUF3365 domain-containing protein n=1 Tax=Schlesneria paludicola TaxID=360056 RepID=A0A7C2NZT1_9PLAN